LFGDADFERRLLGRFCQAASCAASPDFYWDPGQFSGCQSLEVLDAGHRQIFSMLDDLLRFTGSRFGHASIAAACSSRISMSD
jgi:hypothetical protein